MDGPESGLDEELYLTVVPDGRTVLLEDTARLIWLVAVDCGAPDSEVVGHVAALVGRPAHEIEPDVRIFLTDLESRGLLCRVPDRA